MPRGVELELLGNAQGESGFIGKGDRVGLRVIPVEVGALRTDNAILTAVRRRVPQSGDAPLPTKLRLDLRLQGLDGLRVVPKGRVHFD